MMCYYLNVQFQGQRVNLLAHCHQGQCDTTDILGDLLNMSLRSACFIDDDIFWKKAKLPVLKLF